MTGAEFGGVDIDLLADYIGGVLTGTPEESAVAARIATDQAWREAYTSLHDGMAFVSAELGRFEPEPMPADLAARLDAALRTVPADGQPDFLDLIARGENPSAAADGQSNFRGLMAQGEDPSPAGGPAEGHDGDPAGEPGSGREGVAPHLTLVHGDLAGGDVPDPVREKAPAPARARRLRWAAPIAVAAGIIAFAGFGADYLAGRSSNSSLDSGTATAGKARQFPQLAAGQVLNSGTDYTRATLGDSPVSPDFATTRGPSPAPEHQASPKMAAGELAAPALQRLTAPDALQECLAAIEQANADGVITVETVDYARFAGAPALIVRFTAANGHWAWASGADCGTPAGGAATLDKVPVG